MKKTYEKPAMMVETFALTQNIAAGCGANLSFSDANLSSIDSCSWGTEQFFQSYPVCTLTVQEAEGVCYNNPEGGFNIFAS